jgi:hypothetical protein
MAPDGPVEEGEENCGAVQKVEKRELEGHPGPRLDEDRREENQQQDDDPRRREPADGSFQRVVHLDATIWLSVVSYQFSVPELKTDDRELTTL